MDPEDLRRTLCDSADSVALPSRSPRHARRRAAERRRRRQFSQATTSLVVILVAGTLVWTDLVPSQTAVTLEPGGTADWPEPAEDISLHWEEVEGQLQHPTGTVHGDDGYLYAVSTAPGARVEDYGEGTADVPQAVYRSDDGVDWDATELDADHRVADLEQREGVLYTLSTMPGDGGAGSGQVAFSNDDGRTWQELDLPSEATRPDTTAELGEQSVSATLAVGEDRMVAAVRTSYQIVGGVFGEEDDRGYQIIRDDDGVALIRMGEESGAEGCVVGDDVDMEEFQAALDDSEVHVVAEGDSLSSLAEDYYGDESAWPLIVEHNAFEGLRVGDELSIPPTEVLDAVDCSLGGAIDPSEVAIPDEDATDENGHDDPFGAAPGEEIVDTATWEELGLDGPHDLGTTEVFVSGDGETWDLVTGGGFDGEAPNELIATPDGFAATTTTGDAGRSLWYSPDGMQWERTGEDLGTIAAFGSVNDQLVALHQTEDGGVVATSADGGRNWTSATVGELVDGPDLYLTAGAAGPAVGPQGVAALVEEFDGDDAYLLVSMDGENWQATPTEEITGEREPLDGWVAVTEDTIAIHSTRLVGGEPELHSYVGTPVRE